MNEQEIKELAIYSIKSNPKITESQSDSIVEFITSLLSERDELKSTIETLVTDSKIAAEDFAKVQSENAELKKEVERLKAAVKVFEGHKKGYVANGFRHLMEDEELDLIESLLKK